jgi:arylsulfatase A-like enzyme
MMKHFRLLIIPMALVLAISSCSSEKQAPNIVLIISDDQGYGDFGFTGNEYVQTPNLDKLKGESVYFDRFYVSPVCAPTRASLLTGRYHLRTGTTWVTHGKEVMRSEERTIAESLREQGYATGCFGKWHNGEHYPHNPNGQGFDTYFGFSAGHWNNYFNTKLEYNGEEVRTEGYIIDVLTDSSLNFIERNKEKPFFCYIPFNTPHGPFQVADKYYNKYREMGLDEKNSAVYGMCENIDDNVGRILQKLDELKLTENTIVLYLTDNGPNGVRYNAGMKGIKAHVDEGGIRTPLIVRYPGVLPTGDTVFGIASHIDLLPTLHGLAGLDFSEKFPLDGIDLSEIMISGETIPERMIFTHQVNSTIQATPASVRTSQHRLVMKYGKTELYDMLLDPGQKTDIAAEYPDITKALASELSTWFDDVTSGESFIPRIPVGYDEAPRVSLPAPEAKLAGSIQFRGIMGWANDWLIGFESGENSASWSLDVVKTGTYKVFVRLACEQPTGSDVLKMQIGEDIHTFEISEAYTAPKVATPDRTPRTEVWEREWPEIQIGTIALNKGTETISVSFEGSKDINLEIRELIIYSDK